MSDSLSSSESDSIADPSENLLDDVEDSTDRETVLEIFNGLGVSKYHPQTVIQLIQFAQIYVTDVLMEANNISESVNKTCIDIEDLQVVLDLRKENYLHSIPSIISKDRIKAINSIPLPGVEFKFGMHLPGLNASLTNQNIKHKIINNPIDLDNQNKDPKMNFTAKLGRAPRNLIKKQLKNKPDLQNPVPTKEENNKPEIPEHKIPRSYMRCHGSPPTSLNIKKRKINY